MEIKEYSSLDDKAFWLEQIGKSDWSAGKYLYELLRDNRLKDVCGESTIVPMLIDGRKLVSFCTLAEQDDLDTTGLSPWIGFIYTFPEYRGHRYAGRLLEYAEQTAARAGAEYVYISTGHIGLYEKYGYEFSEIHRDTSGEDSRVYRKEITAAGSDFFKEWLKGFEKGLDELDETGRQCLLKCCAKSCADTGILEMYRNHNRDVNGDRDEFYRRISVFNGVRGEIVRPNKEYILIYPECLCDLHMSCGINTPSLCECSRQSILYVGEEIWGKDTFTVENMGTVLSGCRECRFRIVFN